MLNYLTREGIMTIIRLTVLLGIAGITIICLLNWLCDLFVEVVA